jgi:hypothetical protein
MWTFSSWALLDFVQFGLPWNNLFLAQTPANRVWTSQHKQMPHAFLHLFISTQRTLGPFLVALGNCLEHRNTVIMKHMWIKALVLSIWTFGA